MFSRNSITTSCHLALGLFMCCSEFETVHAVSPAKTPEAVITDYMKIPTSQWQQRLPYIVNADKAESVMKKWYAKNVAYTGSVVTSVSGATDPSLYRRVGDTLEVFYTFENPDGSEHKTSFFCVRTANGFKVDWLKSLKDDLVGLGWWEEGRIAETNLPEITVKYLDAVGERYVDKRVKMLSLSYSGISTAWLTSLPGVMISSNGLTTTYRKKAAEGWVGFEVRDRNRDFNNKFFARKDKWADILLELEEGQLINILGRVTALERTTSYGVLVYDIEIID